MGNRISSHWVMAEKAQSDAIDRQDLRKLDKECKILILGSGESGKSTIMKQIKIIYQGGFTVEELMDYRPTIYRNTLDSAQALILAMRKIGIDCIKPLNRTNTDRISDYCIDQSPNAVLSSEIAEAIYELWKDPIIPQLMDHSSEFYLTDSAVYFISNVRRIGSSGYLPTTEDVLRACRKSSGITETRFTMGQLQFVDPYVRCWYTMLRKKKKWIHCLESVTGVIFCAALSEYDQVLLEEKNQNRMVESIHLFESVINSRWFSPRTSITLFLTKIDVFKTKLPKVPLEKYFPEYSGGPDANKAVKYILWRFMQTNRARLSVYPHIVHVTDIANIRLVFAAVRETILQNAFKDSGIL